MFLYCGIRVEKRRAGFESTEQKKQQAMSDKPPQPNIIDQIADERDELRDENKKLRNYIEKLEHEGDYWRLREQDAQKAWKEIRESKP